MIHPRHQGYTYEPEALTLTATLINIDPAWRMPISVSIESGPRDLIRVRIGPGRRIHFTLPTNEREPWLHDSAVHCMVCTADLFCFAKHSFPDISGTCDLWIGEMASGPGLCLTGNNQSHICIPDTHFLESDGYSDFRNGLEQNWVASHESPHFDSV
jgi:hypothetical protein